MRRRIIFVLCLLILSSMQPTSGLEKTRSFTTGDMWKMHIIDVKLTGVDDMTFFDGININSSFIGTYFYIRVGELYEPDNNLFISVGDFDIIPESRAIDIFTIETRLPYLPAYAMEDKFNYYPGPAIYTQWGHTRVAAEGDDFVYVLNGDKYVIGNTYEEIDDIAVIKYKADRTSYVNSNWNPYVETVEIGYFLADGILAYFKNDVTYTDNLGNNINKQSTYVHDDCYEEIHSCNEIMDPNRSIIISDTSSIDATSESSSNSISEDKTKSDSAGLDYPSMVFSISIIAIIFIYRKRH